jgi:hypothetical protein
VRESCYVYADVYCSAVLATFCMEFGRFYLHDVSLMYTRVESAYKREEEVPVRGQHRWHT